MNAIEHRSVWCLVGVFSFGFGMLPAARAGAMPDPSLPSVTSIDLSGTVTRDGTCELRLGVVRGPEGAPAVDAASFQVLRASDEGEKTTLTPKIDAAALPPPPARGEFLTVDADVGRGRTYRYCATYSWDLDLASNVVVVTIPAKRGRPASPPPRPAEERLQVRVAEKQLIWNIDWTRLVRARASRPEATFIWKALVPEVSVVLAAHGDTALLQVKDAHRYEKGAFLVECRAGDERASAFYGPFLFRTARSFAVMGGDGPARVVNEVRRAGEWPLDRPRNEADDEVFLRWAWKLAVAGGEPPSGEVLARYRDCRDRAVRFRLLSVLPLSAYGDWVVPYYEEALEGEDVGVLGFLLHRVAFLRKRRNARATRLVVKAFSHDAACVRLEAAAGLRLRGTSAALPELRRVRDSEPDPEIRFQAALAIQLIRTGKKEWESYVPILRSTAPSREDVELARELYPHAFAELDGARGRAPRKPEGFGRFVEPDSALARFCVLGEATIPVLSERLLDAPEKKEIVLASWVADSLGVGLSRRVEDEYLRRFDAARAQERWDVFEDYVAVQRGFDNCLSPKKMEKGVAEGTPLGRLQSLAWAFRYAEVHKLNDYFFERIRKSSADWFQVASMGFSPDGERLAVACMDRSLRLLSARTLRHIWSAKVKSVSDDMRFVGDLVVLNETMDDGRVGVWRAEDGRAVEVPEGDVSPDGQLCAAVKGRTVEVVNVASGRLLRTLRGHKEAVSATFFAPGRAVLSSEGPDLPPGATTASSKRDRARATRLVTQDNDEKIMIWDPSTGKRIGDELESTWEICRANISPDGSRLALNKEDDLLIVDSSTGAERFRISPCAGEFAFSPDSTRLVVSEDLGLSLHDTATCRLVWRNDDAGPENVVGFSPDGRHIWKWELGGDRIYSAGDGREVLRVDAEHMRFAGGGRLLVVCGNREVSVWDLAKRKQLSSRRAGDWFRATACHDSGLVAAAEGGGLTVWRARTGEVVAERKIAPRLPRPVTTMGNEERIFRVIDQLQAGRDEVARFARQIWPAATEPAEDVF